MQTRVYFRFSNLNYLLQVGPNTAVMMMMMMMTGLLVRVLIV